MKAPIHIGKNVWIGANATVLQGVTIGEEPWLQQVLSL